MKWLVALTLTALLTCSVSGQTNVLTGSISDYGLTGQSNVNVTLTLLHPNPRTIGAFLVRQDPMLRTTGSGGAFSYTNVQWGKYQLSVAGRSVTPFTFWVGTNTGGEVPIASLVTNVAAIPPDPATNYYTQAQIDALLDAIPDGASTLWTSSGGLIYPSGATGTEGGWIADGSTIYPE